MPLKASGGLRSQAQSTVDYFYRVAREHPDGERPENPISPETTYDTQSPPDDLSRHDADLREKEHARNVAEYRDLRPRNTAENKNSPIAAKLAELSNISAEEDDEAPSVRSTTQHPPELIEYDRQVPLIAEPGVDRRRARPEWRFRDRSAPGIGDKPAQNVPASEPVAPNVAAFTPSAPENARELRNDVQTKGPDAAPESSAARDRLRSATQVETAPPEPAYTNPFFDLSEHRRNNVSSLHGPSFLGLDSDSDVEYLDEDEAGSHVRRNIALLVLLIIVVLGALQWRSIRDFGLRYAGTMHLPGRKINAASPADNQAASSNTASPGATTTPPANGQPEIVTEPVRNPNAAQNSNSTQTSGTQNSGAPNANPGSPSPSANSASGNTANTPSASGSDKSGDNTIASNTDNSRLPQGEPADDAADNSASNRADEENPSAARTPARKPAEASRPDPGQAELAQASAALDPASQVSLLWKAVGKGSPEAQLRLADLYLEGRGVPQNCEQALVLLKSASNKNYSRARIRLGSLYATGKCVPQDRVVAYHWMSLALDSSPGSQWVEENRQMLWSQMSEEERRRAGGKM